MNRKITAILLAVAAGVALLLAGWLAMPWVQKQRAEALLGAANAHVAEANRLMATTGLTGLDPAAFSSEAAIAEARPGLESASEDLNLAAEELQAAGDDVSKAAGLAGLAEDYRLYLQKKEELARLRVRQAEILIEAVGHLKELYGSGEAVFATVQEADRLKGQLLGTLELAEEQPASAGQALAEVEGNAARLREQLDGDYERTGFELLATLSSAIGQYEELAGLGQEMTAAAAGGDQAKAQQLAAGIEQGRYYLASGSGLLGAWWEAAITPQIDEFNTLQEEMERLDAEAEQ